MESFLKKSWPDAAMVVLFLLISFAYFHTPITQDLVLSGHDSDAAIGQGREQADYRATHDGETTRWTNSMFSGMPTYQIAPSYSATQFLARLSDIYNLGTSGVLCYVFVFLLGFYVMLRAFNFRPYLAALGAIVWAFSSYFFIIIAAGHIWKVMTLAYIPPTIGGLLLCYRGRLLWGGAVTALFTALQVLSNHVQMTYYFLFVMLLVILAYGIQAFRAGGTGDGPAEVNFTLTPNRWFRATGVIIVAGLLGIAANLPNLYHTYDYAKHTMRGGCELTPLPAKDKATDAATATANASGGLDYDYITQWSYGIGETLTLLVPDFKGGGSGAVITDENAYDEPQSTLLQYLQPVQQYAQGHPEEVKALPGVNAYWGDQPFTVGPVYVGAFIVFLFLLGLFIVRGPMKWALAAATVVSLLFAWGHNVPAVTHFLIDNLPMYNKFRTVSSALVVAEFTMPLLAMLALAEVLRRRDFYKTRRAQTGIAVATALTVGTCLVLWIAPGVAGNCLSADEAETMDALSRSGAFDPQFVSGYTGTISAMRHSVLAASAARSLFVLIVGGAILFAAVRVRRLPAWGVCAALALVALIDMWSVNRRYLNDDNFTDPIVRQENFDTKTPADELILRDKSYYRVLDLHVNTFNDNTTSYWHHSIGGYHAAKLQRYQDIIERQLAHPDGSGENSRVAQAAAFAPGSDMAVIVGGDSVCPVLNMLNMKYVILPAAGGHTVVARNDAANGNGWFVGSLRFVKGADAEMAALTGLDTKHVAVADERFRATLDGTPLDSGTVVFTAYQPNELHYDITSRRGGLVVFSEIYYPGWTATIDGQPAELGRVDYVLRALKVPAGSHKVVLAFHPASVTTTNAIAYAAIGIILLLFAAGLFFSVRAARRKAA